MRMGSVFGSVLALVAAIVAGSANAAVVVNGDFEAVQLTGAGPTPWVSNNPADIPAWTHGGSQGDFLLWNKNGSASGGTVHAGQGNQFVTMGGGFDQPPASSSW